MYGNLRKSTFPNNRGWLGPWIIKNYAPSAIRFGFHFARYDDNIFTPVIRSAIRNQVASVFQTNQGILPTGQYFCFSGLRD